MWDTRRQCIWFVDIKQGRVHRFNPASGDRETIQAGGLPCFLLPADDGGYVLGNGHELQRFDGEKVSQILARVEMPESNRFNDGTVDTLGRIWFGSMDNLELSPVGAVHVYEQGVVEVVGGQCCITNGPAVSGDGRYLYHVDTVDGIIWRFDISSTLQLRCGEPFIRIPPSDGHPDGVTLDAEDHIWVGLWGGWAARRYAPNGTLVAEMRFPVANVTKIAFGGDGLMTAYATTARQGLNETALTGQPLAGSLFSFRVAVPGRPMPEARLSTVSPGTA